MGYKLALEKAGAKVLEFKEFGSWQGDWYAKVKFKGKIGWINGCYGSCSGCDAFQAEFDYDDFYGCEEHRYDKQENCKECKKHKKDYYKRLAEFGARYLEDIKTQKEIEEEAAKYANFSLEDEEALIWLKENKI